MVADKDSKLRSKHTRLTREYEWPKIRDAFINRPTRLTYEELSDEFNVPIATVRRASADEGWPILRANKTSAALEAINAGEQILTALKSSRAIVSAGENVGIIALQKITQLLEDVINDKDKAVSTRANNLNTISFAISNVAKAMKDLGIVGFAKGLQDEGAPNGKWRPELLQQINVTVQNLTKQATREVKESQI